MLQRIVERGPFFIEKGYKMKKLVMLALVLMLVGCGVSPEYKSSDGIYMPMARYNETVIIDTDVKTNTALKTAIVNCLRNSPKAAKYIKEIHIMGEDWNAEGKLRLGAYYRHSRKITLSIISRYIDEIEPVVYHELAHAIWYHRLTDSQRASWVTLYNNKKMGRELTEWGVPYGKRGLPSVYAAKDVREFFAEHYKVYKTDQNLHEIRFWQANDLMFKQGVIARK